MTDAPDGWLIHKGGCGWYRPNARGYTMNAADAGRFTYDDAMSYSHPNGIDGPRDGLTIKHESDLPSLRADLAPQAVRVKPLVWHGGDGNYPCWEAVGLAFMARIERHSWQGDYGLFIGQFAKGAHPTLEAAQSAAQADHDARILAAIEPAPDIGALVDDVVNAYRETVQVQMAWEKRNHADPLCDMGAVSLSRQCGNASDKLQSALAALAAQKGGA